MTPLQEAWKRVWAARRTEGPEFESALFAVVDAATAEGKSVGTVSQVDLSVRSETPVPQEGQVCDDGIEAQLTRLLNSHSLENASDTPDFVLAQYLMFCLQAWNASIMAREQWYGREVGRLLPRLGQVAVDPSVLSVDQSRSDQPQLRAGEADQRGDHRER